MLSLRDRKRASGLEYKDVECGKAGEVSQGQSSQGRTGFGFSSAALWRMDCR